MDITSQYIRENIELCKLIKILLKMLFFCLKQKNIVDNATILIYNKLDIVVKATTFILVRKGEIDEN